MKEITKRIIFPLLLILLLGCKNTHEAPVVLSYEDSLLNTYSFVYSHDKIDTECFEFFEKKIDKLYETSDSDSVYAIYKVDARLFKEHYSQKENKLYQKYCVFVFQKGEKKNYFIAIERSTYALRTLNYLKDFNLLTVHGHFSAFNGFKDVLDSECQNEEVTEMGEYELQTFDANPNHLWTVDSVSNSKDERIDLFLPNSSFNVIDNKFFKFKDNPDSLFFEFKNYLLNVNFEGTEEQYWIVSYSKDYRILRDSNRVYYFLSVDREG